MLVQLDVTHFEMSLLNFEACANAVQSLQYQREERKKEKNRKKQHKFKIKMRKRYINRKQSNIEKEGH